MGVIFALYVTQNLGGSAIDVGLIFGLYRAVRALTAIPIGRYLDKHKGHVDEYYALMVAGVIIGLTYITLFFATEVWHVYLGIIFIGLGHSIDVDSWKVLFYGNIAENAEGQTIGVYETTMQLVYALAIVVAGFVGELYGFEWTLLFAGLVSLAGVLVMFVMHDERHKL